jgi:hypothetical protein
VAFYDLKVRRIAGLVEGLHMSALLPVSARTGSGDRVPGCISNTFITKIKFSGNIPHIIY